jgi:signal transduction histidine kinase
VFSQDITGRKESEGQMRTSHAKLGEELADTELLRDLSAQLVEQGDERALYEKIVEVIATIMRSDFATIQAFHPKRGPRGELYMLASIGLDSEAKKVWEWVTFDTDSTCGQALRTGVRAIASDVETSEFLEGTSGGAKLLRAGIRAAQSTPLFSRNGKFMGMVSSHWREPHTPTERDLRFLDIVARQAADLIERQRTDDDLRRLNHDLEQFAYTAGHDLQEPLRTIKTFSELLRARCGEMLKGDPAVYLGFMTSAATRMEMLIRDLLAYTQIDKETEPVEKLSAEIPLRNALANLAGAVEDSNASVSYEPLPLVSIHATHLRQLFQNLIGNAVKYRHPERECKVHISAECQEAFWVFSVRDNGVGIQDQYRDQIFGLFKRLGGQASESGTGLGLAICKRIVERYHGRIWVESEQGTGSDFRFTLPA